MRVQRVLETCLYVTDLSAAAEFYERVLGLEKFSEVEGRHVFFRCGQAVFLLFNPEKTSQPDGGVSPRSSIVVPLHGAHGAGHVAFAIPAAEITQWRERLLKQQVSIETEIDWPRGGHSIYFRDPSGNSVELATAQMWGIGEQP